MHAEIIALGSELVNGSKLDTNSQWLSTELAALGVDVTRHATIGDSLPDMVEALTSAATRVPLVIITGGLGPTLDDLTRQAMAAAAGVELHTDEEALAGIRHMFESRGREMPERNTIQAMFPEGAGVIPNPRGTAPGIDFTIRAAGSPDPCRLIALPGVPSEMKPMFHESVAPRLGGSGRVIRRFRIHCFGAGESQIEETLGEITARGHDPEVGITASSATITLRIVARGASGDECLARISTTQQLIEQRLGNLIFGYEDDELPDVVVRMLQERRQTVSVIENLTAGRVSEWLHARDEAGNTVRGGLVIGATRTAGTIIPESAANSVAEMAKHCRVLFETDFGIAVGSLRDHAVEIAVSSASGASTSTISVVGNPAIRQSRMAKAALNKLRLRLLRA